MLFLISQCRVHLHTGHSAAVRTAPIPRNPACPPGWWTARRGTSRGISLGIRLRSPRGPRPCPRAPGVSYRRRTTCSRKPTYIGHGARSSLFRAGVQPVTIMTLCLATCIANHKAFTRRYERLEVQIKSENYLNKISFWHWNLIISCRTVSFADLSLRAKQLTLAA